MRFVSAIAAMAFAACASAQSSYPSKAVTTVVGFEPGGGTDTTARIIAPTLSELLGQQVVVENRAGAGGDIAVDYVAKQAPDGYSLVLANVGALAVNPHILKTPYDPLKDLAPVTMAVVPLTSRMNACCLASPPTEVKSPSTRSSVPPWLSCWL